SGRGAITDHLARRAGRVLAIEVDPYLANVLAHRYTDSPNVRVAQADFLHFSLPATDFVVVANIPFNETAAIIRKLAASHSRDMWLVVQREAAHRYAGYPWSVETLQSLLMKPWWHVEIAGFPRRSDFVPAPPRHPLGAQRREQPPHRRHLIRVARQRAHERRGAERCLRLT